MKVTKTAKQAIEASLAKVVEQIPSVRAVLVSDSEGVVLVKSLAPNAYQENSVDVTLAAVYAAATAQASKLQFGKNKSVTTWQKDRAVVYINASPLYISVICSKDGNVGAVLQLAPTLIKVLDPVKQFEANYE